MSNKVSYAGLKLKVDQSVTTFDFNGQEIEVLKYLPYEDKYDLLMITLQKSREDGYYNPFKLDMFFHLNIVYMYTNLTFTDKQRENEGKIYDCLKTSGFFDLLLENMDETEYGELLMREQELVNEIKEYRRSLNGIVNSVMETFLTNSDIINDIIKDFDPSQFQAVVDFATAANGGRSINN